MGIHCGEFKKDGADLSVALEPIPHARLPVRGNMQGQLTAVQDHRKGQGLVARTARTGAPRFATTAAIHPKRPMQEPGGGQQFVESRNRATFWGGQMGASGHGEVSKCLCYIIQNRTRRVKQKM